MGNQPGLAGLQLSLRACCNVLATVGRAVESRCGYVTAQTLRIALSLLAVFSLCISDAHAGCYRDDGGLFCEAPYVNITSPAAGATVPSSFIVTAVGEESRDSNTIDLMRRIDLYVDDQLRESRSFTATNVLTTVQFSVSGLSSGFHSLRAVVADGRSTRASQTISVNVSPALAQSTTTLTASPAGSATYGGPITLTARITSSGATPGGTVVFSNGTISSDPVQLQNAVATLPLTTQLESGLHQITARYSGDSTHGASTSAVLAYQVNKTNTTTALTASVTAVQTTQQVVLSATVNGDYVPAGIGSVQLLRNGVVIDSQPVDVARKATFTVLGSTVGVGTHSFTARYAGTLNHNVSTSGAVVVVVSAVPSTTATSVTVAPTSPIAGQTATYTATVSGGSSPTGQVTFRAVLGGVATTLGSAAVNSSTRQASLSYAALGAGSYSVTASYAGDAANAASASAALAMTVTKASPSTALTLSAASVPLGQSVTYTATINGGYLAGGSVTFRAVKDGVTTTLGTAAVNTSTRQATLAHSSLAQGSYSVTVSYGGDTNNNTSNSSAQTLTVNAAAATTATSVLVAPASPTAGQTATYTATVSGGSGPTGQVTFRAVLGGVATTLGSAAVNSSTRQASLSYAALGAGSYSVTASYAGDAANAASASAALAMTVTKASPSTALTLSAASVPLGQSVTYTATINGGYLAGGSVTFRAVKDGVTTTLGTAAVNTSTRQATLAHSSLTQGSYSVTASYGGDTNNNASNSPAQTLTVNAAAATTSTSVVVAPTSPTAGQTATYTATVSGGSSPTGQVTFRAALGGVVTTGIAAVNSSTRQASLSYAALGAGSYSVTASYGGDAANAASTSSALAMTVVKASPTVALTLSTPSAQVGQSVTYTATFNGGHAIGGAVTFRAVKGGVTTTLGTSTVTSSTRVAVLTHAALPQGTFNVTAVYAGDVNNNGATSPAAILNVSNKLSTTTQLSTVTPSVTAGQAVSLSIRVAGSGTTTPTGSVEVREGATVVSTKALTSGAADISLSGLSVGPHSLVARYTGDAGHLVSASAVRLAVVRPSVSAVVPPYLSNAIAGTLPGKADVRAGLAGYTVPLAMPPGVAGMVPSVSFNHGDSTKNGVLGVGWTLQATSVIQRCGPTIAQDGRVDTVRLTNKDRLCLDGKRLILAGASSAPVDEAYWASGATFRTELETWATVTRSGDSFTVRTRDGRVQYFGGSATTLRTAPLATIVQVVHTWVLRRVEDRAGNAIDYSYTLDTTTGEHLLKMIRWGSNAAAGKSAFAKVEFNYEARPDPDASFIAGGRADVTQRLSRVVTTTDTAADGSGGTAALEYRLSYGVSPTSRRSLLSEIKLCSAAEGCLPGTTFNYGEPAPSAVREFRSLGVWRGPVLEDRATMDQAIDDGRQGHMPDEMFVAADFDGDGLTDLLTRYPNASKGWRVTLYRNTGNGFAAFDALPGLAGGVGVAETGDFDGDGQTDLIIAGGTVDSWGFLRVRSLATNAQVCLSRLRQGQGFACTPWAAQSPATGTSKRLVFDFNGDGRSDIYLSGWNGVTGNTLENVGPQRLCLASPQGTFQCTEVPLNRIIRFDGMKIPAPRFDNLFTDLDADGRADVLRLGRPHYDAELTEWVYYGNDGIFRLTYDESGGDGPDSWGTLIFSYGPPRLYLTTGYAIAGDMNGDGYSDLLLKMGPTPLGTNEFRRCLSTGNGYALACDPLALAHVTELEQIADFDGDGTNEALLSFKSCSVFAGGALQCSDTWSRPPTPYLNKPAANIEGNRSYWIDFTGDGVPELVYYTEGGNWEILTATTLAKPGEALDRLVRVTSGVGQATVFGYSAPGDAATYVARPVSANGAASPEPVYPHRRMARVGSLVNSLKVSNGQGGWLETRYTYGGAADDLSGRGRLGFERIDVTHMPSGINSTTWYRQDWPYTGMPAATARTSASGVRLSRTDSVYQHQRPALASGAATYFPYQQQQTSEQRDLDGSAMNTTSTTWTFGDGWGNATQVDETVTGGGKSVVTRTITGYKNDATNWFIGLPERATVTKMRDGVTTTRTTQTTYHPTLGLPATQTIEPDDPLLKVLTTFDRTGNAFGHVGKTTQTWRKPQDGTSVTRTVEEVVSFDSAGRFATRVNSALGHQEIRVYDNRHGQRRMFTDPNAVTTSWDFDAFGRVQRENRPDGSQTRTATKVCDGSCPAGATHVQITEQYVGSTPMASPVLTFLDSAGRTLRQQSWGANGQVIVRDQRHDARGRLVEVDHPRFINASAYLATKHGHDDLDRTITVTAYDEAGAPQTTTTVYSGLTTTVTNPKNQRLVTRKDAVGLVASSTDALNGVTSFARGPFGELVKVTDPLGNIVRIDYDKLGRRTDLRDPDLGWIHFDLDPLGRVWRQQSPKQRAAAQYTTFEHDHLDRMTLRTEPDLTSRWVYDSGTKAIGKLVETYTGTSSAKDYQRLHTYDGIGRPSTTTVRLDTTYATTTGYDSIGRVSSVTHQRGTSPQRRFDYRYGPLGHLLNVQRAGQLLWHALEYDAENRAVLGATGNGLVEQRTHDPHSARLTGASLKTTAGVARLAEGYQFDRLGNVSQRTQWWDGTGFSETFDYDTMNRLRSAQVSGQSAQWFDYDDIGNLKSKTGVGTGNYVYPAAGAVRPHGVTSIPGLGAYGYDDNGNLASAPNGTTLTWKSFDMPDRVTRGSVWSQFAYGPEHQRARQTRSDGSTVYYAGAMEVEDRSGQLTVKTYWPENLGVEVERPGATAPELLWTSHDRLGSVIALTGEDAEFKEKLAYDAWGKRRTTDGLATPDTLDGQRDNRGFTGHEMLDALDLVHMNGRVYEPHIARFLSADPVIQEPEHSQSYNRYTYVWNNPTNLTDPTGFVARDEELDKQAKQSGANERFKSGGYWVTVYDASWFRSGDNGASGVAGPTSSGLEGKREGAAKERGVLNTITSWLQTIASPFSGMVPWADSFASGARQIAGGRSLTADGLATTMHGSAEAIAEFGNSYLAVSVAVMAETAAVRSVVAAKGRVFTSADPLVGNLATKIDAAYPGHVVGVNVPIRDAAGRLVTDADILLKNGVVQVKSGGGKGLTSQLQRTEQATGLPTIGYGPDLKPSILRSCAATNCERTLIEVVKP